MDFSGNEQIQIDVETDDVDERQISAAPMVDPQQMYIYSNDISQQVATYEQAYANWYEWQQQHQQYIHIQQQHQQQLHHEMNGQPPQQSPLQQMSEEQAKAVLDAAPPRRNRGRPKKSTTINSLTNSIESNGTSDSKQPISADKIEQRRQRNRIAAIQSRTRRKEYIRGLEDNQRDMVQLNERLQEEVRYFRLMLGIPLDIPLSMIQNSVSAEYPFYQENINSPPPQIKIDPSQTAVISTESLPDQTQQDAVCNVQKTNE